MIVSPGMSRKFWRVTPKQLLLSARQNAYLPRNVRKVRLLSGLNQASRHIASINLITQPSRLSWSRESLADADVVVLHKLMIEANEENYLQKANKYLCID